MTDSLTDSDIDRIYGRLQQDINLEKIKTKREFHLKAKEVSRSWDRKLTDVFWDIKRDKDDILESTPEIENLPYKPNPQIKRQRTIQRNKQTIQVKASQRQRSYTRLIGRLWKKEEWQFAQKLKKDGLTYRQIATQLNRTSSSVSTKIYRKK